MTTNEELVDVLRAERDAALAVVERVRAEADAYAEQPDVMELCGAVAQALRTALDGAPESEWEYQCTNNINTTVLVDDPKLHAMQCSGKIERRRKAGPWEPVEREREAMSKQPDYTMLYCDSGGCFVNTLSIVTGKQIGRAHV